MAEPLNNLEQLNPAQKHINNMTAAALAITNHGQRLAGTGESKAGRFNDHMGAAMIALNNAFSQRGTSHSRRNATLALQHLSSAVNLIAQHTPNSISHTEASAALNQAIQAHAELTKTEAKESGNV
jgi:hypothetical protein